ncbi:MAG TPA: hypothetical protein PKC45_02655 [Gemmatales bacterium]|nr:hypothetical protein [Gemmatales bacterium]
MPSLTAERLIRTLCRPTGRIAPGSRRGGLLPLLLGVLALLLSLLALVADSAHLWQSRQELQIAADASALAGVQALALDELLSPQPGQTANVAHRARAVAQDVALKNPAAGLPTQLEFNAGQDPESDLVFGFYEPATRQFLPARPEELDWPVLNALRVVARRTQERGNPVRLFLGRWVHRTEADVAAGALAILDRDVIGFQAVPRTTIPLMPLLLFSDPTSKDERSWEAQVEQHLTGPAAELPLMVVTLPLDPESASDPNGWLLRLGLESGAEMAGWARQVQQGLSPADLADFNGALIVPELEPLVVPAEEFLPSWPSADLRRLYQALTALSLTREARAWPIGALAGVGSDGRPQATVTRFVAARIEAVEDDGPPEPRLRLVLRPCSMVTTTAATIGTWPGARRGPVLVNPYIAKARLVK